MARRLPPVWSIIARGRSWPGIVRPPAPDDPAPEGWEYVYGPYNILKYANDGTPYITDGTEVVSVQEYLRKRQAGSAPQTYPSWLADIRSGSTGATSGVVLVVGDSTEVGSKSGEGGDANTNAFPNSPPVLLSGLAIAESFNARADSWANAACGYSTVADAAAYRPGLTLGTWAIEGRNGFSTRIMQDNNIGQGKISLSGGGAFDTLEVWNVLEAVANTSQMRVTVDSVERAIIGGSTSGSGAGGLGGVPRQNRTVIIALTLKQQLIEVERVAGVMRPTILIPSDSTKSELIIVSAAASGMATAQAVTTDVAGTPKDYTMGRSGQYFPRAYTMLDLGINDMLQAVDPTTTFRANLAALRANHIAASPIQWTVPHYIDPVQVPTLTQEAYHSEILTIAAANNDRIVDLRAVFGSYANMVANGDISSDGVHLLKQGSGKKATAQWQRMKAPS